MFWIFALCGLLRGPAAHAAIELDDPIASHLNVVGQLRKPLDALWCNTRDDLPGLTFRELVIFELQELLEQNDFGPVRARKIEDWLGARGLRLGSMELARLDPRTRLLLHRRGVRHVGDLIARPELGEDLDLTPRERAIFAEVLAEHAPPGESPDAMTLELLANELKGVLDRTVRGRLHRDDHAKIASVEDRLRRLVSCAARLAR